MFKGCVCIVTIKILSHETYVLITHFSISPSENIAASFWFSFPSACITLEPVLLNSPPCFQPYSTLWHFKCQCSEFSIETQRSKDLACWRPKRPCFLSCQTRHSSVDAEHRSCCLLLLLCDAVLILCDFSGGVSCCLSHSVVMEKPFLERFICKELYLGTQIIRRILRLTNGGNPLQENSDRSHEIIQNQMPWRRRRKTLIPDKIRARSSSISEAIYEKEIWFQTRFLYFYMVNNCSSIILLW